MRILFVCTGNICRSAFAEELARLIAPGNEYASAGTFALPGNTATREAIKVAEEFGVDLTSHRAQPISRDALRDVDLVFGAEDEHVAAVLKLDPAAPVALLDPDGADIADPYGTSIDVYRSVFGQIEDALQARLNQHRSPRGDALP